MNDLLRNWIPLVNSLLSRLSIHPNEHDECRQAALLRLWKSIEEGKVMTVTFARIRAKGAMLDYLATRNRTLATEVAVETMPELPRTPNVSFSYLLSELKRDLSNKEYTFLEALLHGTEETLGYSPARLRSLKSELRQKVQLLLG
ncbi:sigma factor [Exiguobacterium sp.]|uniref:sigma factor n=1 Tax=Exiguobacterium sp. TaxID=44751 RepID=UPI0028A7DF2A|nr:sigma factor [Exiguobacterium sp.]